MKIILFALSLYSASCFSNDNKEMQDQLLEAMKKCSSANFEIYKIDMEDCEQEARDKGKISKGQKAKELRECKEAAKAKVDAEDAKCYK